jgi:hypothetical protein
MAETDENNAFRDSLNNSARYPRNLVHHNNFDHILEGDVNRLDSQEWRLFSIRNASGQGHSTVNFPVRNEGGRCARLLILYSVAFP